MWKLALAFKMKKKDKLLFKKNKKYSKNMNTTILLSNPQVNTMYITKDWFLARLRDGQEQQNSKH